jgi:hypothetical protein
MTDNYEYVVAQTRKMAGIDKNKVLDIVNSVYVSLRKGENLGNGYNPNHPYNGDTPITVEKFVFGRLKGYSKNKEFREGGNDRHYKTKTTHGVTSTFIDFDLTFASFDGDSAEDMNAFQRAYENACTYDDDELETIEDKLCIRQNIEFCIDFSDIVNFNFMNLFKNIDEFNTDFDSGIFEHLKKDLEYHDELRDALFNVLSIAAKNRNIFDSVMAEISAERERDDTK